MFGPNFIAILPIFVEIFQEHFQDFKKHKCHKCRKVIKVIRIYPLGGLKVGNSIEKKKSVEVL